MGFCSGLSGLGLLYFSLVSDVETLHPNPRNPKPSLGFRVSRKRIHSSGHLGCTLSAWVLSSRGPTRCV